MSDERDKGERLARIEAIVERIEKELNHLGEELKDARKERNILGEKIDRNFRWTIGILITTWTIIMLSIWGAMITMIFKLK